LSALELELAKEKLTALAIAGKQLQISIAKYRQAISQDGTTSEIMDRHEGFDLCSLRYGCDWQ
jgi:hypothetical protein